MFLFLNISITGILSDILNRSISFPNLKKITDLTEALVVEGKKNPVEILRMSSIIHYWISLVLIPYLNA